MYNHHNYNDLYFHHYPMPKQQCSLYHFYPKKVQGKNMKLSYLFINVNRPDVPLISCSEMNENFKNFCSLIFSFIKQFSSSSSYLIYFKYLILSIYFFNLENLSFYYQSIHCKFQGHFWISHNLKKEIKVQK